MTTISATGTVYIRQNGANIEYSSSSTFSPATVISAWPATVTNTTPTSYLKVYFTTDITLTGGADRFFICGSDYIQFGNTTLNTNGTRPKFIINFVSDYPGLVRNGTSSTNGKNDIAIVNIIVSTTTGAIATGGGWIGQQYFSKGATNNIIVNCSSDGPISSTGGGIVGSNAVDITGELIINSCSSSGLIGLQAGGIIGPVGYTNVGSVTISNSFSTGDIGANAGGICSGYINVINCYSTGNITGAGGGGIFSNGSGNTATNCYSLGTITASQAGGICGQGGNRCNVNNCYSSGDINNNGGGGGINGRFTGNKATNCYTSGSLTGSVSNGGGIRSFATIDGSTNYSEGHNGNSGTWSSTNANTVLQGVGTIWGSIALNTPYVLLNFGISPYRLDVIDPTTYALNQTFSKTVQAGQSTIPAQVAGFKTFQILSGGHSTITIDNTGKITTTSATPAGTYNLMIYGVDDYTTTTFSLTVTEAPSPLPTLPPPAPASNPVSDIPSETFITIPTGSAAPCCQGPICVQASPTTDKDNELLTTYTSGQAIVNNVDRYYTDIKTGIRTSLVKPVFGSYREYMNYLQSKNRYV
jgi:hypothetical protein